MGIGHAPPLSLALYNGWQMALVSSQMALVSRWSALRRGAGPTDTAEQCINSEGLISKTDVLCMLLGMFWDPFCSVRCSRLLVDIFS